MSRAARAAGLGSSSSRRKESAARDAEHDASLHAGFQNLGNTCFLNSVLQATAATRRLRLLYQPEFDDQDEEEQSDLDAEGGSTLDEAETIQAQLNALVQGHQQQQPQSNKVANESAGRTRTPGLDAAPNPAARYAAAAAQIERSRSPALCLADQEHGRRGWAKHRQELILSRPSSTNGHRPEAVAAPVPPSDGPSVASLEPYVPTSADLPLNTAFRRVLEQSWARSSEAGPSSSSSSKKMQVAPVNPKPLLNQMASKYDQYGEYGQQDGHELLRHLLDSMRMEEMDLIKKLQPPEPKAKRSRQGRRGATHSADDIRRPLDEGEEALREKYQLAPFVDTLFCGKLLSAVVCEGCRHVSHTYEDFFDISLPVRPELARSGASGGKRNRIKSMADRWRRGATASHHPPERVKSAAETRPAFLAADFSDAEQGGSSASKTAAAAAIDRPRSAMPDLSAGRGSRGSTPGATGQGPSPADRDKMRFLLKRGSSRARERGRGKNTDSEAESNMPDVGGMTLAADVNAYADAEGILARRQEAVGGGLLRAVSRHSRSRKVSAEADNGASNAGTTDQQTEGAAVPPSTSSAAAAGRKKSQAYIAQLFAEQPQEIAQQPGLLNWMWRGPGTQQSQSHQHQHQQPPNASAGGVEAAAAAWVAAAAARRPHLHHHLPGGAHHTSNGHHTNEHPTSSPSNNNKDDSSRSSILLNQSSTGLIKSLEAFTSVEALEGENAFACKRCWRRENPLSADELEEQRRRRRKRGEDVEDSEHSGDEEDSEEEEEVEGSALSASLETTTSLSLSSAGTTELEAPRQLEMAKEAVDEGSQDPESGRTSAIPIIQTTNVDTPTGSAITISGRETADGDGQTTLRAPKPIAPGSLKRLHAFAGGESSEEEEEDGEEEEEESGLTGDEIDGQVGVDAANHGTGNGTTTDSGLSDAAESTSVTTAAKPRNVLAPKTQGPRPRHLGAPNVNARQRRSIQSLPRRALKRYLISSLPPVLVIHLKRFEMVGKSFGGFSSSSSSKKIDDYVSFPEFLDVGPWLAPPREDWDARGRLKDSSDPRAIERERRAMAQERGKLEVEDTERQRGHRWHWRNRSRSADRRGVKESEGQEEEKKPKTTYRLYAVIVHQGNMSSGHYTAYVLSDRCGPTAREAMKSGKEQGTPQRTRGGGGVVQEGGATTMASGIGGETMRKTPSLLGASSAPSLEEVGGSNVVGNGHTTGNVSSLNGPVGGAGLGLGLDGTSTTHPAAFGGTVASSNSLKGTLSNSSLGSTSGTSANPSTSISAGSGASNTGTDSPRLSVESVSRNLVNGTGTGSNVGAAKGGNASTTTTTTTTTTAPTTPSLPSTPLENLSSPVTPSKNFHPATASQSSTAPNTPTTALAPTTTTPTPTTASGNGTGILGATPAPAPAPPTTRDDRRWVFASDTAVRPASIEEVLKAKAYMLFYEQMEVA